MMAVEGAIQEIKMQPTPTAYFANLMTLLMERQGSDEAQDVNAIMTLLAIVMPRVPDIVLRQKLDDCAAALTECIGQYEKHNGIMRHVLSVLAQVLIAQEASSWSSSVMNGSFQRILSHILDERPKVRKAAQLALTSVLSKRPLGLKHHPCSVTVTRYVLHVMREAGKDDVPVVCHMLAFIQENWAVLNVQKLNAMIQGMFQLSARMNNQYVSVGVYQAMDALLKWIAESAERCQQIQVFALAQPLIEARPNINDADLLPLWLSSVISVARALKSDDKVGERLLGLFNTAFELLQMTPNAKSKSEVIQTAVVNTATSIIDEIPTSLVEEAFEADPASSTLGKMLALTEQGLSLSYQSGWAGVLRVIAHWFEFFQALRHKIAEAHLLMKPIMVILSDDDVYGQNKHYPHKAEFELVVKSAIGCMGGTQFLKVFSLNLDSDQDQRTWILPLLHDSIKNSELALFVNDIIPLAQRIAQRGQALLQAGKGVEGKMCAIVWRQLWELLPGFCIIPVDLEAYFEPLCKFIFPILASDDDRIPLICDALCNFVSKLQFVMRQDEEEMLREFMVDHAEATRRLDFLSKYAIHILPPLFSKYVALQSQNSQAVRGQVLQAIRVWLSVASMESINTFFSATLSKYVENEQDRHSLLDLTIAILDTSKLDKDAVQVLFRLLSTGLSDEDPTIQKKCYKALTLLYSEPEVDMVDAFWFQPSFMKEVVTKVVEGMMTVGGAAKKDRFSLMTQLVQAMPSDNTELLGCIPAVLSEVILGTKESNEKARLAAYSLLIAMARKVEEAEAEGGQIIPLSVDPDEAPIAPVDASLDEFLVMVTAGLAGKTPHMISASIQSLARLIYEFRDTIKFEFLSGINQAVLTYALESKCREIIKSTIGYIKVILVVCAGEIVLTSQDASEMSDVDQGMNLFQVIVKACLKWSNEHKSHFKVPCRYILERLVRKCGLEAISREFPEDQSRLLANIRKRLERRARKNKSENTPADEKKRSFDELMAANASDDEEDSEEDEEMPALFSEMIQDRSAAGKLVNIHENVDDMVDFLDTKAISKVVRTDNARGNKKRQNQKNPSGYKENGVGKLVITESDEEQASPAVSTAQKDISDRLMQANKAYMEARTGAEAMRVSADGRRVKFANRKRNVDEMEEDEVPVVQADTQTGRRKSVRDEELHKAGVQRTGAEYRSKKAKGDIKRQGMPDPYAYIPLNQKVVSKSRKKKVQLNKKAFKI